MYKIGQEEVDAVAKVLLGGQPFRYMKGGECSRFEARYAKYLDVKHVLMTASGTNALTAGLQALQIGPGDEVIVPCHTYMATAVAVLAAGAIPVIVDIADTLTLDPDALEAAVGPRTRAVIPVHMWGLPCDMNRIMDICKRHKLLVIEDACQGVGGGYEGRKLGTIGDMGAFSFNFYKNMTAGEGGAIVTNDPALMQRAQCGIDCCSYYWTGDQKQAEHYISNGARATEIAGAILNVQLDRIDSMIKAMRRQKKRILKETADTGLLPARLNSIDHECGTHTMFTLPSVAQAEAFAAAAGCGIAGKTGRHVYTVWHAILDHKGGHHPSLNPFLMPENKECRMDYSPQMCEKSLDILNRTVMIGNHPDRKRDEVTALIRKLRNAAKEVLS